MSRAHRYPPASSISQSVIGTQAAPFGIITSPGFAPNIPSIPRPSRLTNNVPTPYLKCMRWIFCMTVRCSLEWCFPATWHTRHLPLCFSCTAWFSISTPTNVDNAVIPSGSFFINFLVHLLSSGNKYLCNHLSRLFFFSFEDLFLSLGPLITTNSPLSSKNSSSFWCSSETRILSKAISWIDFFMFSVDVGMISSFIHVRSWSISVNNFLPFSMSNSAIVSPSRSSSLLIPSAVICLYWAINPGFVKLDWNSGPCDVSTGSGFPTCFLMMLSRSYAKSIMFCHLLVRLLSFPFLPFSTHNPCSSKNRPGRFAIFPSNIIASLYKFTVSSPAGLALIGSKFLSSMCFLKRFLPFFTLVPQSLIQAFMNTSKRSFWSGTTAGS